MVMGDFIYPVCMSSYKVFYTKLIRIETILVFILFIVTHDKLFQPSPLNYCDLAGEVILYIIKIKEDTPTASAAHEQNK